MSHSGFDFQLKATASLTPQTSARRKGSGMGVEVLKTFKALSLLSLSLSLSWHSLAHCVERNTIIYKPKHDKTNSWIGTSVTHGSRLSGSPQNTRSDLSHSNAASPAATLSPRNNKQKEILGMICHRTLVCGVWAHCFCISDLCHQLARWWRGKSTNKMRHFAHGHHSLSQPLRLKGEEKTISRRQSCEAFGTTARLQAAYRQSMAMHRKALSHAQGQVLGAAQPWKSLHSKVHERRNIKKQRHI